MQKAYFLRLTQGNYDMDYVRERLKIGAVHERIGLDVKWYLGAYNFYTRGVTKRVFEAFKKEPTKALACYLSLRKLVFLDIGLSRLRAGGRNHV